MKILRLVLTILFHSLRALGTARALDLVLENGALRSQLALLTGFPAAAAWAALAAAPPRAGRARQFASH